MKMGVVLAENLIVGRRYKVTYMKSFILLDKTLRNGQFKKYLELDLQVIGARIKITSDLYDTYIWCFKFGR